MDINASKQRSLSQNVSSFISSMLESKPKLTKTKDDKRYARRGEGGLNFIT